MANHKSAKKRIRQTEKRRMNNKMKTSRLRTAIKGLKAAIESKDSKTAGDLFTHVQGLLGKIAKTGAMKGKTASRLTSRLASQVTKL